MGRWRWRKPGGSGGATPVVAMMAAALFVAGASCAKARPETGAPRCASWKEDIGPLLGDRCLSCHSGASAAGQYDTGSYAGVLGAGTDAVPNAIGGDPGSRLLSAVDPASAD